MDLIVSASRLRGGVARHQADGLALDCAPLQEKDERGGCLPTLLSLCAMLHTYLQTNSGNQRTADMKRIVLSHLLLTAYLHNKDMIIYYAFSIVSCDILPDAIDIEGGDREEAAATAAAAADGVKTGASRGADACCDDDNDWLILEEKTPCGSASVAAEEEDRDPTLRRSFEEGERGDRAEGGDLADDEECFIAGLYVGVFAGACSQKQ